MKHISFHTTHWSIVLAAKGDHSKAHAALSELCKIYREPILRYIERTIRTGTPDSYGGRNAEDLTHDFLARLLEGKLFAHVERREGGFRAYLQGAVRHSLANVRQRESAAKRTFSRYSGNTVAGSLEDIPQTDEETMFDCDWARTTINRAVALLGDSQETKTLLPWLTRTITLEDRKRLVKELGKTEAAVKIALYRLRKKFQQHVRHIIAHTVESEAEIDAELDHLIKMLARQ